MKSFVKHAQEMQALLARKQEELGQKTFEASSGGGMVTATVNGRHELVKLVIDPSVVSTGDVGMLEDLIVSCINEAFRKSGDAIHEAVSGMMGGFRGDI